VCENARGLRKYNNSPAVSVSRKVWRVEPARGKGDRDQSVREEKRGRSGCGRAAQLLLSRGVAGHTRQLIMMARRPRIRLLLIH